MSLSGSYDHLFSAHELSALHARYAERNAGTNSKPRAAAAGAGAMPAVNANEEFCSIVQLTIDRVRLLMAAEVDCVADKAGGGGGGAPAAVGYVELKTSKALGSARDVETFERHKLLKFWLQSFLAGVPSVIVGFRDEAGVVKELKTYETKTIHRLVRGEGRDYWNPTACFNFGKTVLDFLLEQLDAHAAKGGTARRFVMRFEPEQAAVLICVDDSAQATVDAPVASEHPAAKRQRSE